MYTHEKIIIKHKKTNEVWTKVRRALHYNSSLRLSNEMRKKKHFKALSFDLHT